ncbi:LacI family DNA-binding transcriptional regulator [Sodalis ligni]|jgi:LacI family gluconate utilization system Gnt-I transcriptional repressor|uniref:LacI family transcriptional regulator n=1 Tax=Sodalis ligni TaxID=2697027 RepID=A0A4R1NHY8_9GAMM|nr:LacI family DNA-binding transcriptional regulator [Sodalis ligni]QWA12230.1 LacI family DNA-binding transcriptional regulator [Sodalis ligni]TCL04356.1 LacI family transcriptional regulator [Sodalis ligni]
MPKPQKPRNVSARSTQGVTVFEVARLAGVAPITVSRVLNEPGKVKEATLLRVRQVIEETGYVRNQIAGSLASNRTRLVAVIVPVLTNPIFSDTYQAIATWLAKADYQVLLGISGYHAEQEEELIDVVLSRRPDGIILTGTIHTELSRRRLQSTGIPVVETWDMTEEPIDMLIGFSHEEIGRREAQHLLAKGYRDFAIVEVDDPRGHRRSESFIRELALHGIAPRHRQTFHGLPALSQGRAALLTLLPLRQRPLMIVCSSDTLAHGVLTEAACQGINVPGEFAVMGFGDMNFAAFTFPSLSTVRIDGAGIGRRAAAALLERLKGNTTSPPVMMDVGFTLVDRDSTALLANPWTSTE